MQFLWHIQAAILSISDKNYKKLFFGCGTSSKNYFKCFKKAPEKTGAFIWLVKILPKSGAKLLYYNEKHML